ncbi:hypothetical protein PoB_004624600 [Plakobranchus ocellatus]|uniref:Uncharacterized protein n=1 Tax=Plakobranchus ocellatus TaxID=259542 RepID=A0AAV4BL77_9GAST|nr:hypothetical protein PoB_004624600 [Plakobranchus ocellatus]
MAVEMTMYNIGGGGIGDVEVEEKEEEDENGFRARYSRLKLFPYSDNSPQRFSVPLQRHYRKTRLFLPTSVDPKICPSSTGER